MTLTLPEPTPPRTLTLCVTNLQEDEYHFLKTLVAVLTDPGLAPERVALRKGALQVGMDEGDCTLVHAMSPRPHERN